MPFTVTIQGLTDIEPDKKAQQEMKFFHDIIYFSLPCVKRTVDLFIIGNIINAYRCFPTENISNVFYKFLEREKENYVK
jgi:hypothetical protein